MRKFRPRPIESMRPRMRASDGVLVEYTYLPDLELRGKAPTVVFINGWGTTLKSEWKEQKNLGGYNRLFINNRDARSADKGGYLATCARDIMELCTRLEVEQVNLVAHSMAGFIATMFFDRHRKQVPVKTITFINCPDDDPARSFGFRRALNAIGPDELAHSIDDGIASILIELLKDQDLVRGAAYKLARLMGLRFDQETFFQIYDNFLGNRHDMMAAALEMRKLGPSIGRMMGQIDVPVMVVSAEKDFVVSPEAARRIHQKIPGSYLYMFDKSTHAPMIEEPRRFNELLAGFLELYNGHVTNDNLRPE